jgi:hypothetical protein
MSISLAFLVLIFVSVAVYLSKCSWAGMLLPGYVYGLGFVLVFALENYGQDEMLLGLSLPAISNILFLLLFICEVGKITFRKWSARIIVSPFEYLVVLIVLSMPLLPTSITDHYNLMLVAAKALILFVGFKLVLMRQVRRNRKILLAIVISICFLAAHNYFNL